MSIRQLMMTGFDSVIMSSTEGYSGWYAFLLKEKKILLWNVSTNAKMLLLLLRTVHQCRRLYQRKGWRWSAACCLLDNSETSAPEGPSRPGGCHSRKPSWSSSDSTPRLQPTWDPSNWCTPLRASTDCQLQYVQFNWIYCFTAKVWTEMRFSRQLLTGWK